MGTPETAVSVADAMALAKGTLERVRLRVVGEVTDATIKPGYKAIYFSLKDESALMPCLMWRDAYESAGIVLADGQLVEVSGYFTAYVPKGRLQFQVRSIEVAGEGALRMRVAALARRLEAEGLMDERRKRLLPPFPQRIGLVTSPRGKAVHDVIRTLARRYPVAELVVAGVQVEGEGAAAEIVRGLSALAAEPGIDVIILGRGGGSYEDLMPFNDEGVARAVAASPVPVVTGIGHEPDTSIADMVADVRASTPTAAAEAASPDVSEVSGLLQAQHRLLGRALVHVVKAARHRLAVIESRSALRDSDVAFARQRQTLDMLALSLGRAIPDRLRRQSEALDRARDALRRLGPRQTAPAAEHAAQIAGRLVTSGHGLVERADAAVRLGAARLDALSPLAVLGRGFAVCYEAEGAVVRSWRDVAPGAGVRVRLAEGHLGCVVSDAGPEEAR
jgi:exodeoxyribonuclease VII large subunit